MATYYTAFGLTMSGISSKAEGSLLNHKKFVGQEFDEDLEINLYQFKWRNHDPQIRRFIEIDPLENSYIYNSTYAYAESRPINGIDLEGLEFVEKISAQNCTKQWDITIKVVNRSMDSKETITQMNAASKITTERAYSGQDADGYTVTTTANYEIVQQSDVHYSSDLVSE